MPSKVTLSVAGSKKGIRQQSISFIKNLSDKQLAEIASRSAQAMRNNINDSLTRADSTGNLESLIDSEKAGEGHYGVGNIDLLNTVAPYWNHIDKGSVIVGALHNHQVPVGGFNPGFNPPIPGGSGGRWFVAQGGYTFKPKNPIAPKNYIAKTVFQQNSIVVDVLRNVR